MTTVVDFKTVQIDRSGKPYLSDKGTEEYDCSGGTIKGIYTARYAGNMATGGDVAGGRQYDDPKKPAPGSTFEALFKFACASTR